MHDDEDQRWLCAECISDPYLRNLVATGDVARTCSFCPKNGPAISVEDLANLVETAFEVHYVRTSSTPDSFEYAMLKDPEGSYEWHREGEPVGAMIAEAAGVSEAIAEEIVEILSDRHDDFESGLNGEETEFSPDSHYVRKQPNSMDFHLAWHGLENSLKAETRFFNKDAANLLGLIFSGISDYKTHSGRPVIRPSGPGTDLEGLTRARVFHTLEQLEPALIRPDLELGPPPSRIARAGRMNARGISLFYGATNPDVAMAEVRAPVGSHVLVGRFTLTRSLRLLDIDALRSVYVTGSVFDPEFARQLQLAQFVKSLGSKMTMPVMPDDEPSEYLVTQVIADYLASGEAIDVDGILYPSVQRPDGQNVVLFRAASRVQAMAIPDGADIRVHFHSTDEDGTDLGYWVSETLADTEDASSDTKPAPGWAWPKPAPDPFAPPPDDRDPALAVDIASLRVHDVESVLVKTTSVEVNRYRTTKGLFPRFVSSEIAASDPLANLLP